ncbi:condensation domain-containing protein, partial [Rhizobium leguminosarum]|uniref:condensation domain-containing protein n=1 Tax=Rhizobium leguminosarum TaxID=384 RepID=UPI003F96D693
FMTLEALPLTPNGKLDRRALPAPEIQRQRPMQAPRTFAEKTLCKIIADLLNQESVSITDNFFEIGGDSILSFQLISLARRAGITLTTKQIFEQVSIEALAQVATVSLSNVGSEDMPVGSFPLTPIIHHLIEQQLPVDDIHQYMILETPPGLEFPHFVATFDSILKHHHALRIRLHREVIDGRINAEICPAHAVDVLDCVKRVDASQVSDKSLETLIRQEASEAATRLAPYTGRMLQAVWFDAGPAKPGRLLIAIHHLAVDSVSWRILISDITETWEAIRNGRSPDLAEQMTSFRGWANRLLGYGQQPDREAELSFWKDMLNRPAISLNVQKNSANKSMLADAREATFTLGTEPTARLLSDLRESSGIRIIDTILTTLMISLIGWRREQAPIESQAIIISLEGHGRENIFDDVDLSRTVGWFTSLYPVRIDLEAIELDNALAGKEMLDLAIGVVSEQLKAIPNNGVGYGILRYLNEEVGYQLAEHSPSQVGVNYLGRFSKNRPPDVDRRYWNPVGDSHAPRTGTKLDRPLDCNLELTTYLVDSSDGTRLVAHWTWAPALFSDIDINSIAKKWHELLCDAAKEIGSAAAPYAAEH